MDVPNEPPVSWQNLSVRDLRECASQRYSSAKRLHQEAHNFILELAKRRFYEWAKSHDPPLNLEEGGAPPNPYAEYATRLAREAFSAGIKALDCEYIDLDE